ncbi:MAG TPA: extradiol ring-cleavage dioxygenase [Acidimicrobiia bacterium]|nr:extradiol ring-cleavage dioxygenase [Acidimicrobiia bacterium]
MAEIVGVLGVSHNPLMWSALHRGPGTGLESVAEGFERLRARVVDLAPEVLVMIASDHFHMTMTDNMPAFMIGKAHEMRAGFPSERRVFGLEPAVVAGDHRLASHLLGGEDLSDEIDFSFSDEPKLDHSFLVPLLLLNPALNLPLVPVFTNCNAPPIPTARRFARLGSYLARSIERFPDSRRVLVVGSGHLALELGGPRQFLGTSPDPEFDARAVSWVTRGEIDQAVAGARFGDLLEVGNETFQFLNFIACMAVAGGRPAEAAEAVPTRFGNLPFFEWKTR